MTLALTKLLFDTGLFILIWIVQLVIYPSFLHYSEENMKRWHSVYTSRISLVVMPLMLGQVVVYAYSLISGFKISALLISVLILFNWMVTFLKAVPLHNSIEKEESTLEARQALVKINWLRTIAWTLILLISLSTFYAK